MNKYTLGNMGGSDAMCAKSSIQDERTITLSCTTGQISIDALSKYEGTPILDIGIIPKSIKNNNHCSNAVFDDPANCSSFIDKQAMEA